MIIDGKTCLNNLENNYQSTIHPSNSLRTSNQQLTIVNCGLTIDLMIRVAINGFGRIGRQAFKVWFDKHRQEIQIVAVNDLVDAKTLANLLKYDSNYGTWNRSTTSQNLISDIKMAQDAQPARQSPPPDSLSSLTGLGDGSSRLATGQTGKITVDGIEVATFATKEPIYLPWLDLKVDLVIESTGRFTTLESASGHLKAGASKVIISAPSPDAATVVLGVNEETYKNQDVINNASCTTNCIAPVAHVINEAFGIKKAMMTTIHAVTAEQNIVDGPPPSGKVGDLRRARAAYQNIIPTTTGAAIATTEAIPLLKGKFDGMALRVPVPVGSISDFTFLLNISATVKEINAALEKASKEPQMAGILAVSNDPLVSSDIVGRSESAIVDLSLTQVVDGDMAKIFAWYDNEYGYANRLIEQVIEIGKSIKS